MLNILAKIALCMVLLPGVPCFAQAREITHDQFYDALANARQMGERIDRREVQLDTDYEKEMPVRAMRWTWEYSGSSRSRLVFTDESFGKRTRTELIRIGDAEYCRKDDSEWVLYDCRQLLFSSQPFRSPSTKKYTVQDDVFEGRAITLYVEYEEYGSPNSLEYRKLAFLLDENGWLDTTRLLVGTVNPRTTTHSSTITYDYNPKNLKIEAPIKLGDPPSK